MNEHITFGDMANALQSLRDKHGYNISPSEEAILEEAIRTKELNTNNSNKTKEQ